MFDEILQLVKDHLSNNPKIASAIPTDQAEAIHTEIANHISNGLPNSGANQGSLSGLLGKLENTVASGGTATNAIEGGLVSSLTSKFGLPPSVTGVLQGHSLDCCKSLRIKHNAVENLFSKKSNLKTMIDLF